MTMRARESKNLERILLLMKLLQSHLEEANFDINEFEEVEIFLDLALAAGERKLNPASVSKTGELWTS